MKKRTWLIVLIFELAAIFGYTYACYAKEVVYNPNKKVYFYRCTEERELNTLAIYMTPENATVLDNGMLNDELKSLTKKYYVLFKADETGENLKFILAYSKDNNKYIRFNPN